MLFSHQLNSKNNGLVLILKTDNLTALKLFPVVCCYGWKGWKWIETEKNWAMSLKITKIIIMDRSPKQNSFDIFLRAFYVCVSNINYEFGTELI